MLFLLFHLGDDRYALDTRQIVEVIPMITLKRLPQAPAGLAGLFNYRGLPVPALDLSLLAIGRPAQKRLSTRMVIVHRRDGSDSDQLLGLIAEKATETLRRDPADFVASGVNDAGAPYLGLMLADARGLIQWVDVDKMLTPAMRALFDRSLVENP